MKFRRKNIALVEPSNTRGVHALHNHAKHAAGAGRDGGGRARARRAYP